MFAVMILQVLLAIVVIALLVLFLPVISGGFALYHAARCIRLYFRVFADVLGVPDPATARPPLPVPRHQHRDGREPAYPHYLFGPAQHDLTSALSRIRTEMRSEFRESSARIWGTWVAGQWEPQTVLIRLLGLIWIYGLVLGTAVGTFVLVVVTLVQVSLAVVLLVVILAITFALRGVDTALLRLRRIRISCPRCYRPISYPAYRCPTCGALHRDIRPGRYGVLRRRCRCDQQWLPTLLLLGSHRLTACCPHPDCEAQLADRSGTATELTLPIFGGSNAGKTRLMSVLVMTLVDSADAGGLSVEFADEMTDRRFRQLVPVITAGEATRRTVTELPRAYSFYLTSGRGTRRLVHLFDTAGERFYDSDRLEELQYLRAARTFLFVLDPLSVDQLWSGLSDSVRTEFEPLRAQRSPAFVFQQVLQNVEAMGMDPKRARLAIAVTKTDLLAAVGVAPAGTDSAAIEEWLDELGLDHLVRAVRHTFGSVRYFQTTAMPAGGDQDSGVPGLLEWMLADSPVPWRAPA
jgi:hypothetical protein